MDVPGISRPVLVVLIVAAVLLFAFGATKAAGLITQHTDTHTRIFAAAPAIVVHVNRGDVRVVASDRHDVRLQTKEKRSVWGGGRVRVSGDGAVLRLDDRCDEPPLIDGPCSTSYVLEVPRDTAVRVAARLGDLHAEDLGGGVDLSSAVGDVHVEGARGPVRVSTATGDVDVIGTSPDISARTAVGDIAIVASAPRAIRADSAAGDVVVVVPNGTYAVDAQSEGGDDHVGVRVNDNAPRRIHAHSDAGDVNVEPDG
jgi:putative adhesin